MGQAPQELKQPERKARLARIPAFPPIVLRLLNLLSSDDVEIRDLVSLVSSDPAFSAQLLQVANSPLFGFSAQIDSLQSALVVLGLRRVRALTMTVATANHMKAVLRIEEVARCWRHMLACALLTEELARCSAVFEDRAYSAGLLHDVGRLGLLISYPGEYAEILRNSEGSPGLLERERETFGMDHCEAGRILAERWNLPHDFHTVTAHHHDSPKEGQLALLTLVHFGCRLADSLGFSVAPLRQPPALAEIQEALPPDLKSRIHIDEAHWRDLLERRIQGLENLDVEVAGTLFPASEPAALKGPDLAAFSSARPFHAMPEQPLLSPDFFRMMAIGLFLTSALVSVLYFALFR